MRDTVESVGPAWRCDSGGPWSCWDGHNGGRERVGSRVVVWKRAFAPPDAPIAVAHDGTGSLFAVLLGQRGERQVYTVRLLTSRPGSGGVRWWFECPACRKRALLLYLPAERQRLGCRRCCGLVYASQYPVRVRRGKRRGRR